MPKYVEGIELTQEGMHAIFERMGHPNITSGTIYNGEPTIDKGALDRQGFMPVLTGVSPRQDSGHWIMLIKGQGNQYFLFDPLGESSGKYYQNILAKKLPGATLSVIPNNAGLNMGLCGYWVASVGLRAHAALTQPIPPSLRNVGQTITQEMRDELTQDGSEKITQWLRAVGNEFPDGYIQPDATALRRATEKNVRIDELQPVLTGTSPKEISINPTAPQEVSVPTWNGFSLYTDETVRNAARYAYDNYLGKPYTGTVEATPVNFGGQMVYRQHHGLAHTLRTMAYAEVIVEEARKAKLRGESLKTFADGRTLADVTPEELRKIMIAQAFFVTGRDDEESSKNYEKYHEQSRDAFLKYVEENKSTLIPDVFKDEKDVKFYADVIEDKDHKWSDSPAHVLVNQGHMVDLVRVKQPPESYLEYYFSQLQPWIGSTATEAVFATQRQFFHATYEAVAGFDSENKEPHLVVDGLGRYVIGQDGNPIREESDDEDEEESGELKFFSQKKKLEENQRYMRVDEYLKLDEVQKRFPGAGKKLDGGLPGLKEYQYLQRLNSINRARCENDVDFCLGQLQTAHHQTKITPIKRAFQSSSDKARRQPNMDEIAAARIIQQIMANPDCIHDDHVLLNGQKLEEKFFRDLLAKCDMAVVGSLLNDTDIRNIDTLMQHERNTEFHSTDAKAKPVKLGETWEKTIRSGGGVTQIKHDLIFLMQNDAWYHTRVNAIAQNRDKDSTFKEVLITALMTPLTNKSLIDTSRSPAPKTLFRGLDLSEEFKNKLINQAETIIANTTEHLFTDLSTQAFKQIKLNDFSQVSARTCASTSTNIEVPRTIFGSNTIFEILDPDGLLHPKQVGTHVSGSESEYSIYLPEDVALVPIKVRFDGKTGKGKDRHIFTLVAVKSPDFTPRHESGYAVEPLLKMQTPKLAEIQKTVEQAREEPDLERVFNLQSRVARQARLHSTESGYKTFLNERVAPVLEQSLNALLDNNAVALGKVLSTFPSDGQWSAFNSVEARQMKIQMDAIKQMVEKKAVLEGQILPALAQCQNALEKQNIAGALQALRNIPSEKEMQTMLSISGGLRGQIQRAKQDLTETLEPLQRAITAKLVSDQEKVKVRYEKLIASIPQQIADLEKAALSDLAGVKKVVSRFNQLQEELKLLRNEKIRMHTGSEKVDFSDIAQLEAQLQKIHTKLYDAYLVELTKEISALAKEKPKNLADVKSMVSNFYARSADLEQLRQEKLKEHGESKDPIDMSDIDKLKEELQKINQFLVKAMGTNIRVSLNQMEVKTFDAQEKEAQQNLKQLDELINKLESSHAVQKQKEELEKLNQLLVEKRKAYPAMVQLQFRSEALIIHLRELCEAHQAQMAKTRNVRAQEITNGRWKVQWLTDWVGLTTDERVTLANKEKELAKFKEDLNNDEYDLQELISNLAEKNPSELEEAIGISKESAQKLHKLLTHLNHSTTFMNKIDQRLQSIDELLNEFGKQSPRTEMIKTVEEKQGTLLRL
ncbi:T4SS effector NAD-dependent ubiquitin ligase SidE [Legionella pneumophila]|uniref:T4SS effector NAD-dependent ubiquitin ligase SidE n=1 Tax=Legionella pneumophila TaxID=446 RepID=UPI00049196DC|nr:T4SS effector NAD-dependent ubiquitin ligase SidE [Legionella pneumophila]HAT1867929.1 T4SS effector NAD-dependent ubiquitin ligase SidE [Legionella pneumophila]HAT1908059.1 T4SS effector NAD-dependent ubiquitin ligase SidE [Legionella pneumophila]HAT1917008.1 T4SS effector NAD-dependent ubiquitin ligase SidE [Legionella pneumophila]HAT1984764.1 T4SS effector NAD-dependent ubiquitin ligase SidE [Legionella pneumophila]HAT8586255.1 T4SS effector NAD-dependent ubiquitin ligase SidE [Legionell